MEILLPSLPSVVALASVATLGYLFGRQQLRLTRSATRSEAASADGIANSIGTDSADGKGSSNGTGRSVGTGDSDETGDDQDSANRETRDVIRELQRVSSQVRLSLAAHHASVLRFNDSIQSLRQQHADDATLRQLGDEAERILNPTRQLSVDIAHAYDEIRRHASRLQDKGNARAGRNRSANRPVAGSRGRTPLGI